MTDLEKLSRDAAKVLPRHMWCRYWVDGEGQKLVPGECRFAGWLHESTEACAEIMVRVLWPKNIVIKGCKTCGGSGKLDDAEPGDIYFNTWACPDCDDPMQAFRTAVLRALIEVKK